MSRRYTWSMSFIPALAAVILATAVPAPVAAQQAKEAEIALVVPLSGPWARQGQLERMGAEMAITTSISQAASSRWAASR